MPKSGLLISPETVNRLVASIGRLIEAYDQQRQSELIRVRRDMYRNSWFSRSRANLSDEELWSEIEDDFARAAFGAELPWFLEVDMPYRSIKYDLNQLKTRLERASRFDQPIWLELADLDRIPADWINEAASPYRSAGGPLLAQVPTLLIQMKEA